MFGFLKDKLKKAVNAFSEKVEEEGEIVVEVVEIPEPKKKEAKPKKEAKKKEVKKKEEKPKKETKKEKPEFRKDDEPVTVEETELPAQHEAAEVEEVIPEIETVPEVKEKKGFFKRFFGKAEEEKPELEDLEGHKIDVPPVEEVHKEEKEKFEEEAPEKEEEKKQEETPEKEDEPKKGFFEKISQKITAKEINEAQFEDIFWEMEVALLENNVATEVIDKIKVDLKKELVGKPIKRTAITQTIMNTLKRSIEDLFVNADFDFMKALKSKKPYVVCFVGINGSGKTTTIAKVAKMIQDSGMSVVLAAADTFRAAAIDQLQTHADNLGVKLIKHDYGADPAAVAFDAVQHAKSKNIDVVLIDTAGRMHSNVNLLDEMRKIMRVANPDMKIFVGESITGNDCVEQAKKFNEVVELDGIILSKADVDEKGGAALSVSYVTGKPILFLGVGQEYKDIKKFSSEEMMANLGL